MTSNDRRVSAKLLCAGVGHVAFALLPFRDPRISERFTSRHAHPLRSPVEPAQSSPAYSAPLLARSVDQNSMRPRNSTIRGPALSPA
jgi:hypothetical protein